MRSWSLALLLAAFALPAAGQPAQLDGSLWGGPAELVLTPGENDTLRAELGDGAWSGEGRRVGGVWVIPVTRPESVGAAGKLAGQDAGPGVKTLYLLVRRDGQGLAPKVTVLRGGWPVGRFRAPTADASGAPSSARTAGTAAAPLEFDRALGEAPVGECKPTRDAWWARHGVATWGFARALWDFYKPGGRALEELRGPVTRAQTEELREAMRAVPQPWGPSAIYRVARELSQDDREALQLSFGFLVDERNIPLRQIQGVSGDAPIHDKYEHYFASAILAHRSNARGSFFVGWLKEAFDEVSGSGYDEEDLMADALGAEFGQNLHCGQILDH